MARPEYTRCGNPLDEETMCEREPGHLGEHRARVGNGEVSWPAARPRREPASTYTRCDNELVDPSAPSVQCERPRGHAGYHRKRMGVATIEWFNPDSMPERSVAADIPTYARDGRVSISGHDVSSVVSGVTVEADVNDITVITLRLMPGSLDIDAEGKGKISADAHALLVALGWTPPGEPAPQLIPRYVPSDAAVVDRVARAIAECMHNREPDWDEVALAAINAMPRVARDEP